LAERLRAVQTSWTGFHELGLFAAFYLVYFGVRAIAEGQRHAAVANAASLFDLERALWGPSRSCWPSP
jgi:hypothetical protein